MQTDPIYYADNMNMYAYVGNDPVNATDPTGTQCFAMTHGIGSVCAGAGLSLPAPDKSTRNPTQVAQNEIQNGKESLKTTAAAAVAVGTTVVAPELVAAKVASVALKTERAANALSAANKAFNKTGISQAARSWEKHAGRPNGTFEPLKGNVSEKNQAAEDLVCCILKNPQTVQKELSGGAIEYRQPDGQGFRVETNGNFNFVDPSWNF